MLRYRSGEEIRRGDHVEYHAERGSIDFVVDASGDSEFDWYRKEFGSGVMVLEPKVFGSIFVSNTENDEDLVFVARAE